jgi:hypothetical protein
MGGKWTYSEGNGRMEWEDTHTERLGTVWH